jgi:hypothetical protein
MGSRGSDLLRRHAPISYTGRLGSRTKNQIFNEDVKITSVFGPVPVYILSMTPSELHRTLLNREPDPSHVRLYDSGKKGFADKSFDQNRFLAVAMITLQKTMRKSMSMPSRVMLLIAPTHEKWVREEFDLISAAVFKRLKTYPASTPAKRLVFARNVGECFKIVGYHTRLLQLPDQPESWTSFGFSKEDYIPDWMRNGLLED